MRFKVLQKTAARAAAEAVWVEYHGRECTARGLPPGSSLDTRAGKLVVPPITVRYVDVVEDDAEELAALPVDDFVESLQGRELQTNDGQRVVLDVSGNVDIESLPEKLRDRVRPPVEPIPVVRGSLMAGFAPKPGKGRSA